MNKTKKQSYHHGNLKQALVDAALMALETENLENLSLRSIAKTLGVTPAAVYGHFSDKTALLIELRTLGFQQLRQTMQNDVDSLPANGLAEDKIRTLARSYMAFAMHKRHLFDILFSWTPDLSRITPECAEEGAGSENILRKALVELLQQQGHELNEYQRAVAAFSAWSLVHGISMLLKTESVEGVIFCKQWPPSFSAKQPESQARVIEHLLTIEIEGLKAAAAKCQP